MNESEGLAMVQKWRASGLSGPQYCRENNVGLHRLWYWAQRVYELSFDGVNETLRGSGSHPLYSLDRDDWVRIRDLQIGERLQTGEVAVTVEALKNVRGLHRVYNLEVEGEP